jgi:hypothetical protein
VVRLSRGTLILTIVPRGRSRVIRSRNLRVTVDRLYRVDGIRYFTIILRYRVRHRPRLAPRSSMLRLRRSNPVVRLFRRARSRLRVLLRDFRLDLSRIRVRIECLLIVESRVRPLGIPRLLIPLGRSRNPHPHPPLLHPLFLLVIRRHRHHIGSRDRIRSIIRVHRFRRRDGNDRRAYS